MESRSLGQLTSSCRHVTRERRASWSRDISPPRDDGCDDDADDDDDDDDDASPLLLEKRARSRSRDESHWLARPVGTGLSAQGRRRRRQGRRRRTEGRGRAAGEV